MRNWNQCSSSTANSELRAKVQAHLDDLTKPQGSLGRLEELAMQYCLCRGDCSAKIDKMELYTFAGDHGVVDEGVAPFPKEVTRQMVLNMAAGGAAIASMCRTAGIQYRVVDMGVDADFAPDPAIIPSKIGRGTRSFLHGPAMDPAQAEAAIEAGFEIARRSRADLLGIGEMGIGNTSSASALYGLMLTLTAEETVGVGTGATGAVLERKRQVIKESLALHRKGWDGTAFNALCRVGGFEIAGMAGFLLGAASRRVPVVVDGFIATAAAMVAGAMAPNLRDYLYFAHASAEKFHLDYLEKAGVVPILQLGMRLGEGTGAALAMQIIHQAMNCYNTMATFSSAGVSGKGE